MKESYDERKIAAQVALLLVFVHAQARYFPFDQETTLTPAQWLEYLLLLVAPYFFVVFTVGIKAKNS